MVEVAKKIFIASDHAGYDLKGILKEHLASQKYDVEDLGTNDGKTPVDYPDYAKILCEKVLANPDSRGVLVCGSGIGISIAANKVKGIRCGLCHDYYTAVTSREHNDCNVVAIGARVTGIDVAKQIVDVFLKTKFLTDQPRHVKRVEKLNEL